MNKFLNLFKKNKKTLNLPIIIEKERNSLKLYTKLKDDEEHFKDPLMLRINIRKYNYIYENSQNHTVFIKAISLINKKFLISKYFQKKFRNEKVLHRINSNPDPAFNQLQKQYDIRTHYIFLLICFLTYFLSYWYTRIRHDIYIRRYGYIVYPSYMIMFDMVNFKFKEFLKKLDKYHPKDFSDKEAVFLIYDKMNELSQKRKLKKKLAEILETDKELLEIDNLLKKIN